MSKWSRNKPYSLLHNLSRQLNYTKTKTLLPYLSGINTKLDVLNRNKSIFPCNFLFTRPSYAVNSV